MSLNLPASSFKALPASRDALLDALKATADACPTEGFLQVARRGGESFLFFHQGLVFAAGAIDDGRVTPLAVSAFMGTLNDVTEASLTTTDLPLFLCAAVMFRKAPAAHIPLALIDSESLLKSVEAMGKDTVLVVGRGDARTLVFCRGGAPTVLYPARHEAFPRDGAIADRIIEYALTKRPGPPVTMDVYDDIQMPRAEGGGVLLHTLFEARAPATPRTRGALIVKLGGRVVFGFPLGDDDVFIGRGDDIDLVLDNLSVSRRHAKVSRHGDSVVVTDLQSENGLMKDGARVDAITLKDGDEVGIGKYTLLFAKEVAHDVAPVPKRAPAMRLEETVALAGGHGAFIEHRGKSVPMKGALFSIGSGELTSLRVRGFFIGETHVAIIKEANGFRARHVGGRRKMRVNGAETKDIFVKSGDVIAVGAETFTLRVDDDGA